MSRATCDRRNAFCRRLFLLAAGSAVGLHGRMNRDRGELRNLRQRRWFRARSIPKTIVTSAITFAETAALTIGRRRRGKGFFYVQHGRIVSKAHSARIAKLAIPPAWEAVRINPDRSGHLQALGRDVKGRLQYIYHAGFREHREQMKFARLSRFGELLPEIRARIRADMAGEALSRTRVLATTAFLLDRTLIRIGNAAYASENKSFGLTTLRSRHATFEGFRVRLRFRGKSGREWAVEVSDRRAVGVITRCHELPGEKLFQYVDDEGAVRDIRSTDVNAYLQEIAGRAVSAKDFRTWWGSVLTLDYLQGESDAGASLSAKAFRRAIAHAAERLGNTVAVCRSSYIHPVIARAVENGYLSRALRRLGGATPRDTGMTAPESIFLSVLKSRAARAEAPPKDAVARKPRSRREAAAPQADSSRELQAAA